MVSPPVPLLEPLEWLQATRSAALIHSLDGRHELLGGYELVEAQALLAARVEDEDRRQADDVVLFLESLGLGGIVIGGVDLDRNEALGLRANFGDRPRIVIQLLARRAPLCAKIDDD